MWGYSGLALWRVSVFVRAILGRYTGWALGAKQDGGKF